MDTQISVITNDGRNIIGILRGFDQTTNLILEECFERVYSEDSGVEQAVLGLYIIEVTTCECLPTTVSIPSPSVTSTFDAVLLNPNATHLVHRAELLPAHPLRRAIIGELDEELGAELDLANTRAPPLKAIVH